MRNGKKENVSSACYGYAKNRTDRSDFDKRRSKTGKGTLRKSISQYLQCVEPGLKIRKGGSMYNRCTMYFDLKEELESYEKKGVRISINGRQAPPRRAAQVCCFETDGDYMRDYIIDDSGRIVEIGFDKVKSY